MIAAAVLALSQILLSPCTIPGVVGPARCGTYRVWENRETKRGRQIDLSIIVLGALGNARKRDPLFMLQGGPGDAPSFNASFYSRVFANIRQNRDLVLVDLRGTGKSAALTCPELARPDSSGVLSPDMLGLQAVRDCRLRLEKTADLRLYTTEIAIDDLDEVRNALGYERINLYGTSYGTRAAQVYMRRHPKAIRTVTLKGVVPPSMASPATHARTGDDAWRALVQRCATDDECGRTFPTLAQNFDALLLRLEQEPVVDLPVLINGAVKIKVTRGLFAEGFRSQLYSPESAARVPSLLAEITDDRRVVETILATRLLAGGDKLAAGFFLSVSCTEDVPYLPKNLKPLVAGTFGRDYRLQQQIQACSVWPRGRTSALYREPLKSAIPTLLLSGEFDPVTPPAGGAEVARTLSQSTHVVIRNNGHPIGTADKCIADMLGQLLEKGSVAGLDQSCANKIPAPRFAVR